MINLRKNLLRFLVAICIGSFLLFSYVGYTSEAKAVDIFYQIHQFIETPIIRAIANLLASRMNNQITNTILNVGGKGPLFITDWRSEILGTQSRGADVFRSILAGTQLCPHLDTQIKGVFMADKYTGTQSGASDDAFQQCLANGSYDTCKGLLSGGTPNQPGSATSIASFISKNTPAGSTPFNLQAQCTLPTGFDVNTFSKTGFTKPSDVNGFLALLRPENSRIGLITMGIDELQNQLNTSAQADNQQRLTSGGFKPKRDTTSGGSSGDAYQNCLATGSYDTCKNLIPASASDDCPNSERVFGRCVSLGGITTPATLISSVAGKSIGSNIDRLVQAHDWTDLVSALIGIVTAQLNNYKAGTQSPETMNVVSNGTQYFQQNQGLGISDGNSNGASEYASLNACISTCGATANSQCAGETDPSKKVQCQANARQTCYADCSTMQVTTSQQNRRLGDPCDTTSNAINVCSQNYTPALMPPLSCSATTAVCSQCEDNSQCFNGDICDRSAKTASGVTVGVCVANGGNALKGVCMNDSQCSAGLFCNQNKKCRASKNATLVGGQQTFSIAPTPPGGIVLTTITPTPNNGNPGGGQANNLQISVDCANNTCSIFNDSFVNILGLPANSNGTMTFTGPRQGSPISVPFTTDNQGPVDGQGYASDGLDLQSGDVGTWTVSVTMSDNTTSNTLTFTVTN